MHTTTTEYKGFTIETESYDGIGTVTFRSFIKAEGFNKAGYSTLNNAKGAITKYLKAKSDKFDAEDAAAFYGTRVDDPTFGLHAVAPKIRVENFSGKNPVKQSRNKREGGYAGKLQGRNHVRIGKRVLSSTLRKIIPVPSWLAAAWQSNKEVRKVGV